MYNKIFAKIVRSSIWLEPTPTRIVWLMFIALMDEDGFVQFASVANVAHTARIEEPEAAEAIRILESQDPNSADQDYDGRRIERVPGGWLILSAKKYRDLVTREMIREQTRERVARHRAKLKQLSIPACNVEVTPCNALATQSEVQSKRKPSLKEAIDFLGAKTGEEFWDYYQSNGWRVGRNFMKDWRAAARRWKRSDKQIKTLRPKESAPVYPKLPEKREPTDEEFQMAKRIATEHVEKLKEQFKMP